MRALPAAFLALAGAACSAAPAPLPAPVVIASAPPAEPAPPRRTFHTEKLGSTTRLVAYDGGRVAWSVGLRGFPSTDPYHRGGRYEGLAVAGDGSVLVANDDGALIAFDGGGHPRFQLGVRGRVSRLEATAGGGFVVTLSRGRVTTIGPDGTVLSETQAGAGEGPIPRAPQGPPTVAFRVRRAALAVDRPFADAQAAVALAPDDVWALVGPLRTSSSAKPPRLFHWDGAAWADTGVPRARFAPEAFSGGGPKKAGELNPRGLARSAGGTLLLLGARDHGLETASWDGMHDHAAARAPVVLERTASGFRERRELFEALSHVAAYWTDENDPPRYAAGPHGEEALTVADTLLRFGAGKPLVVASDRSRRPIAFVGSSFWSAGIDADARTWNPGAVLRDGQVVLDHSAAGPLPPAQALWGSAAGDVWVLSGGDRAHPDAPTLVSHLARGAVEITESPVDLAASIEGTAPDDVWIAGARGAAHFDGRRWSRLFGIPEGVSFVTAVRRGEAWIGGAPGLWHVTPDASAEADLELAVVPTAAVTEGSRALPVAGTDAAYRLERVVIPVDGEPPLAAAVGLAEGPGGVLWLHDYHRVVAYDAAARGRARDAAHRRARRGERRGVHGGDPTRGEAGMGGGAERGVPHRADGALIRAAGYFAPLPAHRDGHPSGQNASRTCPRDLARARGVSDAWEEPPARARSLRRVRRASREKRARPVTI